ncbi:LexA family transcriptional regulator
MPNEMFVERLKELIGDNSANSFAREVGIGESLIRKYLAGGTPGLDKVVQIASKRGVSLDWLAGEPGAPFPEPAGYVDDLVVRTSDGNVMFFQAKMAHSPEFALIPRLGIEASAGGGLVPDSEDPLEYLAFQSTWLRTRGINPSSARILSARGDSMEETIRDGDVLLVDTSINRVKDNAIYVVTYGDMVLVKRVHGRINGSLQLISDNPKYPSEEVSPGEVNLLNVAGRVMWFGRSI